MTDYVPRQGDLVSLSFDPQSGHEQRGRRPALVVSKDLFNDATGLAMVCPIANTRRGFPLHVAVPEGSALTGFGDGQPPRLRGRLYQLVGFGLVSSSLSLS